MKKQLLTLATLLLATLPCKAYNVIASITQTAENTWEFSLDLQNNKIDYTAFQLDITLEGSATLPESGLQCSDLMGNHLLALGTPDNHYRIVGYSLQNTSFTKREGSLARFTITGDLGSMTINNILFAQADGTAQAASDFTYVIDPDNADAVQTVEAQTPDQPYDIYNLSGQKVNIGKDGIYIINGKKVLIKK